MAPAGNPRTRTRHDGTVMVQTAPHRWVSVAWLRQQGGEAKKIIKSSAPEQTYRQSAEQGTGHNCLPLGAGSHRPAPKPLPRETSPQPATPTGDAGRRSGIVPDLRKGEVGRAGRAGEVDKRQPLPLPISVDPSRTGARDGSKAPRGRQPRGEPNPKREAVLNLYGRGDSVNMSHGDIAKAAGVPTGSVGAWISMGRTSKPADARVVAGDRRRGRG